MGMFSFIKDAGAKIGIGKSTAEEAKELADKLSAEVKNLGLEVKDLQISIDDDAVKVSGEAKDQATREKVILSIGNTEGVATVDDNMTVVVRAEAKAEEAPDHKFYTIIAGDTLSKVALDHYGDASKYPVIFEANTPMLKDPNEVYVGQVLRIPPTADSNAKILQTYLINKGANLQIDSVIGAQTIQAINNQFGSVAALQTKLNDLGANIQTDGAIGDQTLNAFAMYKTNLA